MSSFIMTRLAKAAAIELRSPCRRMLFDEAEFFAAIARSGARVLLIGRRAMIALGLPVLTADYDLWVHIDDIDKLNQAAAELDFEPSCPAGEARRRGRYVLENGQHVDVMVARGQSTRDAATRLEFHEAWERRVAMRYAEGVMLFIPSVVSPPFASEFARP